MQLASIAWLIPVLPLLGAALTGFLGKKAGKSLTGIIGSSAILGAFILSVVVFLSLLNGSQKAVTVEYFQWFASGSLNVSFAFLLDPLSAIMLLVITGVGFLIHVYSIGYMHDDEGFHRFFAYMNLFVFFMLLLVMGDNYLLMFAGWEGVGLCSYLLIGFWFKNHNYNNAAKKAFIMNRIGDLGFVLGIFLLYTTFGSVNFAELSEGASGFSSGNATLTTITLLLFIGAIGKSAQIPLYTWLPDAMAGPTPVSALIHAATMVTAGIYMIARSNVLFALAPVSLMVVGIVGLATALFAATIALAQTDIKKVLAYSTVSQLGLMFAALGVGAFSAGIFHLVTHAFFKALLFLAAGSVIHALGGAQDIRGMGGLRKKLPITFIVFMIGTIAIAGIPPFSGFFSKDEILAHLFSAGAWLWIAGTLTSLMTAFYMFRLLFLSFYGSFRGTREQEQHLHESPSVMTIPLITLAILSAAGGLIGLPEAFGLRHVLSEFLDPVFALGNSLLLHEAVSHSTEFVLMGAAVAGALAAMLFAYRLYVINNTIPDPDGAPLKFITKLLRQKYYVDEFYDRFIVRPLKGIAGPVFGFFEEHIFSRTIDSVGRITLNGSRLARNLQAGYLGFYIFAIAAGIILILLFNRL